MPLQQEDRRYTYSDYITWPDEERWELIDGVPYAMSPAPSQAHQSVSWRIAFQLATYLKGKPCQAFTAPFDVRLNANEEDNTVVRPDILVVCDKAKLDGKCCNGAPDFVVEILSSSTATQDRVQKFEAYLTAGVREYWIVDPETRTVQACILHSGFYGVTIHRESATVPVSALEGCMIDLAEIFAE